jgi:hypothetical protein
MIGLICGALFFNLPLTTGGIFSRAGLLYFMMMFAGISVFASIPEMMQK